MPTLVYRASGPGLALLVAYAIPVFAQPIQAMAQDSPSTSWSSKCWIMTPEERKQSGCIIVFPDDGTFQAGTDGPAEVRQDQWPGGGFIPSEGGAAAITVPDRELFKKDLQIENLKELRESVGTLF